MASTPWCSCKLCKEQIAGELQALQTATEQASDEIVRLSLATNHIMGPPDSLQVHCTTTSVLLLDNMSTELQTAKEALLTQEQTAIEALLTKYDTEALAKEMISMEAKEAIIEGYLDGLRATTKHVLKTVSEYYMELKNKHVSEHALKIVSEFTKKGSKIIKGKVAKKVSKSIKGKAAKKDSKSIKGKVAKKGSKSIIKTGLAEALTGLAEALAWRRASRPRD